MKKIAAIIVLVLTFFLVPLLGIFWWINSTSPISNDSEKTRFVISKGASAETIGKQLEEENLIKSALAFKIYLQLTDKSKSINSGEFMLSQDMELKRIVEILEQNPSEVWVTIPEGYRREQIAETVASELEVEDEEEFVKEFLNITKELEGQLFPDTYLFAPSITPAKVMETLTRNFEKKYKKALDESGGNYDTNQILTMASLIERETLKSSERPTVSGILWKRLDNDWPLQVDASVQYVWGSKRCGGVFDCEWWEQPTSAQLDVDSPFNTYKTTTLPPAPIANPGYDSILAAMNPEISEYWFYLHDSDGKIHYGETVEEHGRNISKYINNN
ncbi:endolytic transglycosylase MltG [Patescibacteria group bacterium]